MKTPSIFVSYRRSDAEGWAGRLCDSLRARLAHVRVFRDIEEIPPGVDFVEHFTQAVGECDAFIEIIGPEWLTATDATGRRRLDDPNDSTRLELVTALKRNIRVIPVLVESTAMPKAEDLPEDLRPLARRNAFSLSDARWSDDTRKLADILREIVRPPRRRWPTILAVAAGVAVVAIGMTLRLRNQPRRPDIPNNPPTSSAADRGHGVSPARKPKRPADQPLIEIQSAICRVIAPGQYRVAMAGRVSGPAEVFFYAMSDPNNGVEPSNLTSCQTWSRSEPSDGPRNQNVCKRRSSEPTDTAWKSSNIYRSDSAPPQGCATLYLKRNSEEAAVLGTRCTALVCQ